MAAKKGPRGALWGCGRGGQSDGHSGVKETGDGWAGAGRAGEEEGGLRAIGRGDDVDGTQTQIR